MNSGPTIDYDALQQEAMRGLVRAVLTETAKSGLPGEHHFYVSFNTRAPGVVLSRRLKEKYPREMTIVLQHRFWGLTVSDDRFEVNLTFDGIPERLVIPFQAIRVFVDPSVRFGLQFEIADIGPGPRANAGQEPSPVEEPAAEQRDVGTAGRTAGQRKARPQRKRPAEPSAEKAAAAPGEDTPPQAERVVANQKQVSDRTAPVEVRPPAPADKVVSLDAFRKR